MLVAILAVVVDAAIAYRASDNLNQGIEQAAQTLRLAERTNFLFSLLKEAVTGSVADSYSPAGVSICSLIRLQAKWNPAPAGDEVRLAVAMRSAAIAGRGLIFNGALHKLVNAVGVGC